LFDRPKPTTGCSVNGRRRRRRKRRRRRRRRRRRIIIIIIINCRKILYHQKVMYVIH
jgi:hypothetical protein